MGYFLITGLVLGLASGITPGPLLLLTLSETLRHGPAAGAKVACAPLLTDAPILLAAWFLLTAGGRAPQWLDSLNLVGGAFLLYLGWDGLRYAGAEAGPRSGSTSPWLKGAITNALNPYPYAFWFTVGAPLLIRACDRHWSAAAGFALAFFSSLIGSKLILVAVAGRTRDLLRRKVFVSLVKVLGLLLWVFAAVFLYQGLLGLGVFGRG